MSQSDQSGAPTVSAALPQDASHSTAAAPPAADQNSGSDEDAALAHAYTVDRDCPHVTQSNIDRSVFQLDGDTLKDEQLLIVSNGQSVAISPTKRTGAAVGDIVNPKRQRTTKNTERVLNANELSELQKLISLALTVTFEFKVLYSDARNRFYLICRRQFEKFRIQLLGKKSKHRRVLVSEYHLSGSS